MKSHLLLLLILFVALPALAAAPNTAGSGWGAARPSSKKPQWHGECCYNDPINHGWQPGTGPAGPTVGNVPRGGQCNLAGVWKETPYSKAWGEKRLVVTHRNGSGLIQYGVKEFGLRIPVHEIFSYNANKHTVQRFLYAAKNIFVYSVGKVSPDCRHMNLMEYSNDFATRKVKMTLVRH